MPTPSPTRPLDKISLTSFVVLSQYTLLDVAVNDIASRNGIAAVVALIASTTRVLVLPSASAIPGDTWDPRPVPTLPSRNPVGPTLATPTPAYVTLDWADRVFPSESPPPVPVWDETKFQPMNIHRNAAFWVEVLIPAAKLEPALNDTLIRWVTCGVTVPEFFKTYTGPLLGADVVDAEFPPDCELPNQRIDDSDIPWLRAEIADWEAKGAIKRVTVKPHCVLPLGVTTRNGKRRAIWDGRVLNCFTPSPPMRYQTIRQLASHLEVGDYLLSLDHKTGYHHVGVVPESTTFLGFKLDGVYYELQVLPFGWAPSCFIYDSLSSVVSAFCSSAGIPGIHYLDDFGFTVRARASRGSRRWAVWFVCAAMFLAGYFVSLPKSILVPTTSLPLLGFIIDTISQTFSVPEKKRMELVGLVLSAISAARSGGRTHVTQLQSLLGKAQSMSMAAPPISMFLRSSFAALSDQAGSQWITLPLQARLDLECLYELHSWSKLSLWPREIHASLRMETDACLTGWGGSLYFAGQIIDVSGHFPRIMDDIGIHVKESLAVEYTFDLLGDHLFNCFLDLYTDNTIVQHTLLHGNALDESMRVFARKLLRFQLTNNVIVRVHRIDTVANARTDALSRIPLATPTSLDRSDHRLNPSIFRHLQSIVPAPFTIDACANQINRQLPRYIALQPCLYDPPVTTNVFSYTFPPLPTGEREYIYCNPPWAIIDPLWRHFKQTRARGVMLVPDIPTRHWYGSITREAVMVITLAARGAPNIFFQPSRQYLSSVGPLPWGLLALCFDF